MTRGITLIGGSGSGKTTFMERSIIMLKKTKGYNVSYPTLNFLEALKQNKKFNELTDRRGNTKEAAIVEATIKKGGPFSRKEKYNIRIRDTKGRKQATEKKLLEEELLNTDIVIACIDLVDYPNKDLDDTLDLIKSAMEAGLTACIVLTKKDICPSNVGDIMKNIKGRLTGQKGSIKMYPVNNFEIENTVYNPAVVLRNILEI